MLHYFKQSKLSFKTKTKQLCFLLTVTRIAWAICWRTVH